MDIVETSENELFDGVIGQVIDNHGKCRMLIYENGVVMMTSPLPPLDVEMVQEYETTLLENALEFIQDRKLRLIEADGDPETRAIQGLWVKPRGLNEGIQYGYIPINISTLPSTKQFSTVRFAPFTVNDPIRTDDTSELREFLYYHKLSIYLSQYTFLEYSLQPERFLNYDDVYLVDENHEYPTVFPRVLISGNPDFYKDGKIIVPSLDTRDRLIYRLQVELLNNPIPIKTFALDNRVRGKYNTVFDFRHQPNQLLFLSRESLMVWKRHNIRKEHILHTSLLPPETRETYFFRHSSINNGKPTIVQNTDAGLKEDAVIISTVWAKDKLNIGRNLQNIKTNNIFDPNFTYRVFTEGRIEGEGEGIIVKYEDGRWGSILPL